ncbi:uncharacterized protein B0I36DRAFT_415841 [Microdochium trichocladiopsis]|uniref:Uncharacterized protein n=1 Tax=Microdochium trichocladiopsis TaxID=1682393 RepID=A0A9P9BIP9_9PEZI|nr:uncharacterized protein B0I36DRAFT_415841 [Microdochium trichocladiopsis]KAH7024473.1 hypothetical protein B0I36DRAFT_415841 [Microdochium trichocladiopsis]
MALVAAAAFLPRLATGKCSTFDFTSDFEQGQYVSTAEWYFEKMPGGQMPLTKVVDCTAEAGATGDCPIDRYPMVLPFKSYARDMDTESWEYISGDLSGAIRALRASPDADQDALEGVNFDSTVFYNFTIPPGEFEFGHAASLWGIPVQRCWYGTVGGCDAGDAAALEGKQLAVWGYPYVDGTGPATPRDQASYYGYAHYVQSSLTPEEIENQPDLPYVRSSEFDWSVAAAGVASGQLHKTS